MLPSRLETVRVYLHVLAATTWVGGQLALAGLVPGLRSIAPDAPKIVARRFNQIAWPAFAVLVVTGLWNISAVRPDWSGSYGHTLMLKIAVVAPIPRARVRRTTTVKPGFFRSIRKEKRKS